MHVSYAMDLRMEKLRMPHDNRTFPGEGGIDFASIWQQLSRLGYNGAISLEIWNRQLHQSDPAEVVRQGSESLQVIERALNHQQR